MGLNKTICSLSSCLFCLAGFCNGGWSANIGYFRIRFRLPPLTKAQNPQCLKVSLAILFFSHHVVSCSRLFLSCSLDISLPLINIIVIVYYADLSCDMQELALIGQLSSVPPLIGWFVPLCPWLGMRYHPSLGHTRPGTYTLYIAGLWMLWFSRFNALN